MKHLLNTVSLGLIFCALAGHASPADDRDALKRELEGYMKQINACFDALGPPPWYATRVAECNSMNDDLSNKWWEDCTAVFSSAECNTIGREVDPDWVDEKP